MIALSPATTTLPLPDRNHGWKREHARAHLGVISVLKTRVEANETKRDRTRTTLSNGDARGARRRVWVPARVHGRGHRSLLTPPLLSKALTHVFPPAASHDQHPAVHGARAGASVKALSRSMTCACTDGPDVDTASLYSRERMNDGGEWTERRETRGPGPRFPTPPEDEQGTRPRDFSASNWKSRRAWCS